MNTRMSNAGFIPLSRSSAAFTLTETLIALAIGTIAIGGAMSINSQQLRLVKATRDASAASHSLQERIEQVRTVTWPEITSPTYVSQTLFSSLPRSIAPLDDYRETITLKVWPERSPSAPGPVLSVTKTPKSAAKILSSGTGIADERLVKVDVQIRWGGKNGNREHLRELSTIVSNGGISRLNLPAMGPLGGGIWDDAFTSPTTTPDTTPTSTTGGNSGNGNSGNGNSGNGNSGSDNGTGRGNVGGVSGKK